MMSVKMLAPIQNHQVHLFHLEVVIADTKPQPTHDPGHLNRNLSTKMVMFT
jgi:hypothetical protein